MCGITGLVFDQNVDRNRILSIEELKEAFKSIVRGEERVDHFLSLAWTYKSAAHFFRYYRNKEEREEVACLCESVFRYAQREKETLLKLDADTYRSDLIARYNENQKLLDAHWFLSTEVAKLYRQVFEFMKGCDGPDHALLFYKNLSLVLNSIAYLETRGRDSLGIAVQWVGGSSGENRYRMLNQDRNHSFFYEFRQSEAVYTYLFRTANRVGALGENVAAVRKLILEEDSLHERVLNENFKSVIITAHTRWASAGEVSLANCHPLSSRWNNRADSGSHFLVVMNGDIYNHREIVAQQSENLKSEWDPECTTDGLAVVSAFQNKKLSAEKVSEICRDFEGSYALALLSSENPGFIYLVNQGNQGLYLGASPDGLMFASDVYGLIENCPEFASLSNGTQIDIHPGMKKENFPNFSFRTTQITTRDIDQRGYPHYLLKEIMETQEIVERTLLGYLQSKNKIEKGLYREVIVGDVANIPESLLKALETGFIREIIITGMGTCYTAAVAIAGYMRKMLRHYLPDLFVQPHVASEGSAFYLRENMEDTLVIVVAQSGTTVDTNVYVQMAKEKGARTLAIVNKREGDVTFIVEGTLYIGSGRDIEIAVPSTKTYTAQTLLGFILTLFFCCRLHRGTKESEELIQKHFCLLQTAPDLIRKGLASISRHEGIKNLSPFVRFHSNWYVAFDDSPNDVCAMELRIKYSESCYQSLPYLHINDLLQTNVSNAFITYLSTRSAETLKETLDILTTRGNKIVLITSGNADHHPSVLHIPIPDVDPHFSFIPTIIAGQLISYHAALNLDRRKHYFENLLSALTQPVEKEKRWNDFAQHRDEGNFNQGFLPATLEKLENRWIVEDISSVKPLLEQLYADARRPIDTIKHQAKTITVGAVRRTGNKDAEITPPDWYNVGGKQNRKRGKSHLADWQKMLTFFREFYIYPEGGNEAFGYFAVQYLNDVVQQNKAPYRFYLAQPYDLEIAKKSREKCWIFMQSGTNAPETESASAIRLSLHHISFETSEKLAPPTVEALQYRTAISLLLPGLIENYGERKEIEDQLLNEAFHQLFNNKEIAVALEKGREYFASRPNWKILGSGSNYNAGKYLSKAITKQLNHACAFDVLENHKHVDISAEPAVMIIVSNIWNRCYQNDVAGETAKMISHNNLPVILTNIGDTRFDRMKEACVIHLPKLPSEIAFPFTLQTVFNWMENFSA